MAIDPVKISFIATGVADVSRAFDSIEQRMIKAEENASSAAQRSSRRRVLVTQEEAKERVKSVEGAATAEKRIGDGVAKEVERLEQFKQRIRMRSAEMAGRYAEQQANAEIREAERAALAIERTRERVSRGIGHAVTRGVGHSIGGMASLAGGALGIGGGFFIAETAAKEMAAQRQAALLVNAVTTGGAPPPGANVASILAHASGVSRETGMGKEDVIGGMLEYSRKARGGDFEGVKANAGFFAKLSKVTGTDIRDIAGAAGTLQSQNANLKAPEMQQMLLDVYAQGKAGSMSMIDVAAQMGTMASARSSFQGNAADNQRKLLALGQLAAPEGSVGEAGTYVKDLAQALAHPRHVETLKQWGVQFDKFGAVASPENLIESVFRGSKGNINQISGIFGARGVPIFRGLEGAYTGAGGGEAGIAAVHAKMASVTGATMTGADLESQFQQLMSTPAERFQKALNDVSEVVSERVEPILGRLAGALEANKDAVEHFMNGILDVAEWLVQNPWKGIGTAVTLSITKELAVAGIGQLVGQALTNRIGQGGGIIAAAAAITITGMAVIDWLANKDVGAQRAAVGQTLNAVNDISNVNADIRSGKVTPADVQKIQQDIKAAETAKADAERGARPYGGLPIAGGSGLNLPGIAAAMGFDNAAAAAQKRQVESTTKDLALLSTALQRATAALNNHPPPVDGARHVPIGSPGR